MTSRSNTALRARVISLLCCIVLLSTGSAAALDPAQQLIYDQGIDFFDLNTDNCGGATSSTDSGVGSTPDYVSPTAPNNQIDQTLVLGFSDTSAADAQTVKDFVKNHPYIGGIFFHGNVDSQEFNVNFFDSLQREAKAPLLIMSDDEGGPIHRFLTNEPAAGTMAKESANKVQNIGKQVGSKLATIGVNTLLAPVLDTYYRQNSQNADNKWGNGPDNSRSFGTTGGSDHGSANIIAKAGAFAQGVSDSGLGVVYKHFPGIGQLTSDTDSGVSGLGSTNNPLALKQLTDDLAPYKALANKNNGAIMLSHVHVKDWNNGSVPVSESNDAVKYIRSQNGINFNGLIVSDDLGVPLGDGNVSNEQEVARALTAGVNMPLITPTSNPDTFVSNVEQTVSGNHTAMQNVRNSQDLIAAYKSDVTGNGTSGSGTGSNAGNCCSVDSPGGTGGGNGGTKTPYPVLQGKSRQEQAFNYLTTQSVPTFTAAQAAGIIGNLQQESGLDPTIGDSNGAVGIAQWSGDRLTSLKRLAAKEGKSWSDYGIQLQFLVIDMPTQTANNEGAFPYLTMLEQLEPNATSSTNATQAVQAIDGSDDTAAKHAAVAFLYTFERAGDPRTPNRENYAVQFLKQFGSSSGSETGSGGVCGNGGSTGPTAGTNLLKLPQNATGRNVFYVNQFNDLAAYDNKVSPSYDFGTCGCGPASALMIQMSFDKNGNYTSDTLNTLLHGLKATPGAFDGGAYCATSNPGIMNYFKNSLKYDTVVVDGNDTQGSVTDAVITKMKSLLQNGYLLMVDVRGSYSYTEHLSSPGHHTIIYGYDNSGFYVANPGWRDDTYNKQGNPYPIKTKDIKAIARTVWAFKKPGA